MTRFDKSKLPSRHVSVGAKSAPHRSYYYAMGMTEEEINQPLVGVVTTWNEAAPCNIALARQAQSAEDAKAMRTHVQSARDESIHLVWEDACTRSVDDASSVA